MFRNTLMSNIIKSNNSSKTQTKPQTQTQTQTHNHNVQNSTRIFTPFTGSSNSVGSTTTEPNLYGQNNLNQNNDNIMYAIITGNLNSVRTLINSTNVNTVIDRKNNYTAIHHAVRIKKNDQIIEYLLSVGANPYIKQDEGKDAIDLTIESNYRFLIDKLMKQKEAELDNIYSKFDDVNYKYKNLDKTNQQLEEENKYLKKSTEQYVAKVDELKTEINKLKTENTNLGIDNLKIKRKYEESETAFSNLLKKTKK